jgi:nucleoside-diphosphate-sugar epimerase
MQLLITGADRPLGQLLCVALGKDHQVNTISRESCDHRQVVAATLACEGIDAIVHCDVFDPLENISEQTCLDWATRGTYVLMQAARNAGVERVVIASRLSLFEAYPEHYVVDETWQPQPHPQATSLAPYLAELACREFAREGGICAVGLRLGALGFSEGTAVSDGIAAFKGALELKFEPLGYRWQIFHVFSGKRFPMRSARKALGLVKEGD